MTEKKRIIADCLFTLVILLGVFTLNMLLQSLFQTYTMTPMIFVLGVFLVSFRTQGYFWGIAA